MPSRRFLQFLDYKVDGATLIFYVVGSVWRTRYEFADLDG